MFKRYWQPAVISSNLVLMIKWMRILRPFFYQSLTYPSSGEIKFTFLLSCVYFFWKYPDLCSLNPKFNPRKKLKKVQLEKHLSESSCWALFFWKLDSGDFMFLGVFNILGLLTYPVNCSISSLKNKWPQNWPQVTFGPF